MVTQSQPDNEYIQLAEARISQQGEILADKNAQIATLQARVEELTKALQFYADARRYQGANQHPIPNDPYGKPDAAYIMDVTRDGGSVAVRALATSLERSGGAT